MGGAHPTRTFWVSPTLRCPWTALGFGSGTAFCGFGFVFCGYGCAHLTRTGVVPHLTRTSLLRVVNAFGHRHVWGSCRSALLSTSPPSVVTPSLPRRSILVKGGDSAFDRGTLCASQYVCDCLQKVVAIRIAASASNNRLSPLPNFLMDAGQD